MTPATVTQLHRYVIERVAHDDGDFSYEVIDTLMDDRPVINDRIHRRCFCVFHEDDYYPDQRGQAKKDAEMVARALNYWNIRGAT